MLDSLLQLASSSSLQDASHSLAQSSHSMLQAADHHFSVQRFGDYQPNYSGAGTTLYVLAIVAIVLGAAVMLLTIAFRRSHMFVAMTFMGWGVSYYLISRYLPNLSTETVMWSSALAGLGFGLLGAELTIGTFLCGVSAGVVVWWVIFSADPTIFISPNDLKYSYVLLVPLGLGMGIIALALGNLGIVFSTPFIGSFMIVQGLNYFYNANLQALYVLDRELGSCLPNNCYYYLGAGIGGGVLLGWIVQAALLRRLVYIANEGEVVEKRGLFRRTRRVKAEPATYAGNNRNAAYEETVIDNNRGGYAPNQYGDSYGQTPSNRYNGGGYSDDYPTLNVNNQRGSGYRQPAYYA